MAEKFNSASKQKEKIKISRKKKSADELPHGSVGPRKKQSAKGEKAKPHDATSTKPQNKKRPKKKRTNRRPVSKTLHYFRSIFDGSGRDLEALVARARRKRKTVDSSEQGFEDDSTIRIQSYRPSKGNGILIYLAKFTSGDKAPTVKRKVVAISDAGLDHKAPTGQEYKDGGCYLLIQKHNILLCSNGIGRARCELYLRKLFQDCEFDKEDYDFSLFPAANQKRLAMIQDRGVSSISLNSTAYDVTTKLASKGNGSWLYAISQRAKKEIASFILKDDSISEQKVMADMMIRVELSLRGGMRAEKDAQETMGTLAESLIDENDQARDGFSIMTKNGDRISPDEIRLNKKVSVIKRNKTVSHLDVWEKLVEYHSELRERNLLEQ